MTNKLRVLRCSPVFSGISDSRLKSIASLAKEISFSAGQRIYSAGDEGKDIYVHVSGDVVFSLGAPKAGRSGGMIATGDAIGWAALSRRKPARRLATATAQSDTVMLVIDGDSLLDVLDADPELGYRVMSQFMQYVSEKLVTLSTA